MDENAYRSIHRDTNPVRCVFEKTVLSTRLRCSAAQKLCLAEREAISCVDAPVRDACRHLLDLFIEKSRFALRRTDDAPLTHSQSMKIQIGGLNGLRQLVEDATVITGDDIRAIVTTAQAKYSELESLPFSEIVREIVHTQWRNKKS